MHNVQKNQPPTPFRGWDIRGGAESAPHALHNNQGVGRERDKSNINIQNDKNVIQVKPGNLESDTENM